MVERDIKMATGAEATLSHADGELTPKRARGEARQEGASDDAATPPKTLGPSRSRRGDGRRRAAPDTPQPVKVEAKEERPSEVSKASDNAVTARLTKTKMCWFFERGKCASLDCRYAHSTSELRHQPNLQKTKLCKLFQEGKCQDGENCVFAHGEEQLRVTDGIYKTQMCHFFERGQCLKGDRCNHAHGPEDLRVPLALATPTAGSSKVQSSRSAGEKARGQLGRLALADLLVDSPGKQPPAPAGLPLCLDDALGGGGACGSSADISGAGYGVMPAHGLGCPPPWLSVDPSVLAAAAGEAPMDFQALAALALGAELQALSPSPGDPLLDGWPSVQPGCDLGQSLASLDALVADLSEEVRQLTQPAVAGLGGGLAAGPEHAAAGVASAARARGPRTVHRI